MPNYRKIARQKAQRYGINPTYFERQIGAESNFNPSARSPMGASGIAQIMPGTAAAWGVNPSNPVAALDAAAKNMGKYLKQFGGDWRLALGAYNAGPGNARNWNRISETRNYVNKILGGGNPKAKGGGAMSPGSVSGGLGTKGGTHKYAIQVPGVQFEGSTIPNPKFQTFSIMENLARAASPTGKLDPISESNFSLFKQLAGPETIQTKGINIPGLEVGGSYPTRTPVWKGTQGTGPRGQVRGIRPGGGWGGSKHLAQGLMGIGKNNGLDIVSEKRPTRNTTSGNMSDHYEGNDIAYAYDLSNGSSPTPEMDRAAEQIARRLGVKGWKGGVLNVTKRFGGATYRFQVLYRTDKGGNHYNHIHVGVKRV